MLRYIFFGTPETDRQTDRQPDTQPDRQTDSKADRQADGLCIKGVVLLLDVR